MSRFPGVGQRVRQRLRALGYWKDGRPDVGRFCSERNYRPQYLYAWLGDRIPTYDNLARLARDLEVPPEWVMFGTGSPTRRDALDAVDATRGPRRGAQIIDFARLRDVTSKLVRLEAELEAIFRAFPDLYVWLDTEGRVLAYEGGSGGSFDVSLELARGKKIAGVFPSASGLRLEAALRQFLDAPSPVSTEFALGAKRYEARLLPLPVESGAQRQLLMIVRDITERKQAEEATTALARVGHELVGTLDLEEATARVVTAVLHHFRVDRACFFELDRTSGNLLCVATAGEHGGARARERAALPRDRAGQGARPGGRRPLRATLAEPRAGPDRHRLGGRRGDVAHHLRGPRGREDPGLSRGALVHGGRFLAQPPPSRRSRALPHDAARARLARGSRARVPDDRGRRPRRVVQ